MMNLDFIRRGLSPHGNGGSGTNTSTVAAVGTPNHSQQKVNSSTTPSDHSFSCNNTDSASNRTTVSSFDSVVHHRKRNLHNLDMIDFNDLPSPPSLFSSSSTAMMMEEMTDAAGNNESSTSTIINETTTSDEDAKLEKESSDDSNIVIEDEQDVNIHSQTTLLKTQFPPSTFFNHENCKQVTKNNDSLNNTYNDHHQSDDEESSDDEDDELREFSLKVIQSRKKRKLNLISIENNEILDVSLHPSSVVEEKEENKQHILLTQLPHQSTSSTCTLTTKTAGDTAYPEEEEVNSSSKEEEDELLNNAIAPRGNDIVKSLEDNIEFTFPSDDEELSQIPKQVVEEDFDIHVDLQELEDDDELSPNVESTTTQKPDPESTQPKKCYIDMSIQTDNFLLPTKHHEPVKIVNSLDPNNICSICISSWSSTGLHQVCCLSCGHLFGKNCIEKWLKKNSTCPKCKKPADRTHIRLLYVDNIQAVDTQKIDDLENRLEAEIKAKKELELIKNGLELRIKMLTEQKAPITTIHTTELQPSTSLNYSSANNLQSADSSSLDVNKRKSLIQRSLELAERKKREFDLFNSTIENEQENGTRTIVCCNNSGGKSKQSRRQNSSYLYGSSGVSKLLFNTPLENSTLLELSNNQLFINFERRDKTCGFYVGGLEQLMSNPSTLQQTRKVMHNSPITCIKPHYLLSSNNSKGYTLQYSQSNIILTSSLDKTMRITDLRQGNANSVCFCPYLSANRESPAVSITCCEWNRTNQNYCFAGLSSGSVLCYDVRNPGEPFLTTGADQSTICCAAPHTMFHIPNKGLVVGSNESIVIYDENQYGYTKSHKLFSGMEISSLNFNTSNNTLLYTCRESSKSSQLQIFTLEGSQKVNCLENISINHKGPKLGRPFVSDNGQNFLSTIAIPKPEDYSVEIWKSQTDQDYSFKNDIKLQSNTEIVQSCALQFNNLFVVTRDNLSAYLI